MKKFAVFLYSINSHLSNKIRTCFLNKNRSKQSKKILEDIFVFESLKWRTVQIHFFVCWGTFQFAPQLTDRTWIIVSGKVHDDGRTFYAHFFDEFFQELFWKRSLIVSSKMTMYLVLIVNWHFPIMACNIKFF